MTNILHDLSGRRNTLSTEVPVSEEDPLKCLERIESQKTYEWVSRQTSFAQLKNHQVQMIKNASRAEIVPTPSEVTQGCRVIHEIASKERNSVDRLHTEQETAECHMSGFG